MVSLPEPLGAEEERRYVKLSEEGDQDARNVLVERNLRLVVYIAKRFDNTGVDLEELVSVGTIGLIKAVKSYDSEKKIKLATYASRCIENEILMFLRKMVKTRNEISLDEPL
ncbi:MAG: sigma-70 family RNA polymerase sigma factor, partial [Clostridia bacterium]|nr:sigma-70 family RNA polymerase sigma factor [Clostridia bacterium]